MKIVEISTPLNCPMRGNVGMMCWHNKAKMRKCNEDEMDTFPAWCPLEDAK